MAVGEVILPAQGTGTTQPKVAVDQIAGREYQLVKLVDGAVDNTTPVVATAPADAQAGKAALWVSGQLMVFNGTGWDRVRGTIANGLLVDVSRIVAPITVAAGSVSVTSLPTFPSGDNNIGNVDVVSLPSIPAGNNNIGNVDVLTLPSLPAGNANIGDVDVASLPSLPAGANAIGTVGVTSLPTLPAGNNNIGDVDIATWIGSAAPTVGQKAAAASLPVVLASDQSTIPVNVVSGGGGSSPTALAAVAHTVAAATTSSTTVLAANASRRYALIENISDEAVFLKINAAAANNQGIKILAGGGAYEMSLQYGNLSTAAIHAIHAGTGSKTLLITEGT